MEPVHEALSAPGEVPHFAVPLLEIDGLRLSQTAAIARYVGETRGLAGTTVAEGCHALQLAMTVMDLLAEVHDVHHPVSTSLYYEDQLAEARHASGLFRAQRLPKFLERFDAVLAHTEAVHPGAGWLLGSQRTYADLFLAHAVDGLSYAFPVAMAAQLAERPRVSDHRAQVFALPRVAAYRASERRMPFNEHGIFRHYPDLDDLP
jgi:glutathione S-transferase